MSLASLMNTSVAVQRKTATRDSSGGQVENFATVDGLDSLPALIQPTDGKAQRTLGQRQVFLSHHIYLASRYDVRRGDRLYEAANDRYFLVHGFENMAGQSRGWRVDCVEQT